MTEGDTADRELLARLTLDEKVSLLSGRDHWSLPALPTIGLDSAAGRSSRDLRLRETVTFAAPAAQSMSGGGAA